ncbi:MAG: dihydroneopterin aldolase [Ferrovibrio sp.]|uniref:dihydroneopterin aldolase n=1 Tax=Ferrovibrio sp. TaxID=1917215 RepID=UPI00261E39E6|nr:dihydroneopterin aldolase [Ferrovibrio sp.]MCW0236656.1 dihydroneopterin aldolase [Ferrovibrio sp.]
MTIHDRARAAWAEIPVPVIAEASQPARRVFVRDLLLDALIGIYPEERTKPQKILINLDLWVAETPGQPPRSYAEVVCYENLVKRSKALLAEGHVDLVETLAERLASLCLDDSRVLRARVRVEKPEAITEAAGVGVEIERRRA